MLNLAIILYFLMFIFGPIYYCERQNFVLHIYLLGNISLQLSTAFQLCKHEEDGNNASNIFFSLIYLYSYGYYYYSTATILQVVSLDRYLSLVLVAVALDNLTIIKVHLR